MGGSIFSLLGAFAGTIGLLLLALRFLKKIQGGGRWGRQQAVPMTLLQRLSVGPKQGVALLRVGERVFIVSMSDHGVTRVGELNGADLLRALAEPERCNPASASPRRLFPALARLMILAILALSPMRLQAQSSVSSPSQVPAPSAKGAKSVAPGGVGVTPPAGPQMEFKVGEGANELKLSGTVGLVVLMGAMTLLPAIFLLMTSFTRILIVLQFMRTAIGAQGSPPGQLLVAIAVLLTGVVMNPVLQETNRTALQPYLDGQIAQAEAYRRGLLPFRHFMMANTREQDIVSFAELSGAADAASVDDVPTVTIVSAFVTGELRTAFYMGFVIFLPFVVVDLIVASALMSLGMFMLPPAMISLPFKLLLFVLADGWTLVAQKLVESFHR